MTLKRHIFLATKFSIISIFLISALAWLPIAMGTAAGIYLINGILKVLIASLIPILFLSSFTILTALPLVLFIQIPFSYFFVEKKKYSLWSLPLISVLTANIYAVCFTFLLDRNYLTVFLVLCFFGSLAGYLSGRLYMNAVKKIKEST